MSFALVGERSHTLILCILVDRVMPPLLHLLLGLGNDVYSKFKEFIAMRIERLSQEELEVQNMTFFSEIKYDKAMVECDNLKNDFNELIEHRIDINSRFKERGRTREYKGILRVEKTSMLNNIKEKTLGKDEAEKNMNECQKRWKEYKAIETKTKSENKDASKNKILNHIESVILNSHRISRSYYHARDLEGNDIRRLIAKGSVVFEKIRVFLHNHKPSNVSNEEIDLN